MKRNLIISAIVIVVLVGLMTGCGGKKIGKLSEADFIELNAQMMVIGMKERDPEVMETKMKAILEKYDVTEEEMNEFCTGPDADEMMQRIGPKIMQRVQELNSK